MSALCDRLAAFFHSRPNEWIDGRELAHVAGSYAWRTRVSELRHAPYVMELENRVRTVKAGDGSAFRISEYRYAVPIASKSSGQGTLFATHPTR